jgi:acyl dehydratase
VKHFEDFKVGEVADLGSCTLTEAEILAYARKYDPQPFHTDPEAARRSIYGGLIASGWHTCALMMRLSVEGHRRVGAVGIGSPGIDSCRWLRPVRPGDTLRATTEVLEAWPSRSKPIGFVRRRVDMTNQRGEVAMSLTGISMYARRDPEAPVGEAGPVPRGSGPSGAGGETGSGRPEGGWRSEPTQPPAAAEPSRPWPSEDLVHFEDLRVGDSLRFGRYEVTTEEVLEFARQFDPQPFHLDETAARGSIYGGLIASGWHTGAMFIRMVCDHMVPRVATAGALGFDDLRWIAPVRPGDVLAVESVIRDTIASRSRPDRGTVKIESRVLDQRGEAVMSLVSLVIYLRRPGGPGTDPAPGPSR